MISSLIGQGQSGKILACRMLSVIKSYICMKEWYIISAIYIYFVIVTGYPKQQSKIPFHFIFLSNCGVHSHRVSSSLANSKFISCQFFIMLI